MKRQNPGSKHSKSKMKKLNDEKWLKKELAKGKSAQEILGITNEEIDEFYDAASYFFEKEKYVDAVQTYLFLITLNPRIHEFWLGLAMSSQMCGDFDGAIDAYQMIAWDEIDTPVPYFYLAKCFLAVNDYENALSALDVAIEMADGDAEFKALKKEAQIAKNWLIGEK